MRRGGFIRLPRLSRGQKIIRNLLAALLFLFLLWNAADRPVSLALALRWEAERYGLPLVVSENGLACTDRVFLDGAVHDSLRIDFLTRYLRALERAIEQGTDVRGYFQWSLTYNFEWAEGYDPRFGLAYVDYATGDRTLKDSGRWYRDIIRSNGADL